MGHFHLSVILFGIGFITLTNAQCQVNIQNGTVFNNGSTCSQFSNSTFNGILTCSGLTLSNLTQGQLKNLKGFSDAAFDLYNLMRSRRDISLVASGINGLRKNATGVGLLNDEGFARIWFQVKLSPYLSSLSNETLSCLSQSNLTCLSFQALVNDLSTQISPERQRMVYQNFIKPFLTRKAGCAGENSSEWLTLNFRSFSALASYDELKSLNANFTGLTVLDQLSPEQKAQLIFFLESAGKLNSETISNILEIFMPPFKALDILSSSNGNASSQIGSNGLSKNLTDFLILLRPVGRFVRSFVDIVQTKTPYVKGNITQLLVEWAQNKLSSLNLNLTAFNTDNIMDWYTYVGVPVLKKFTNGTDPQNITAIFNIVFPPDAQPGAPLDVCRVSRASCLVSQTEESLSKAITCVALSNLSFTEENLQLLTTELSKPMRTLTEQTTNSQTNLTDLFAELPAESFITDNLGDVEFMKFWFQIKMRPLLPTMPVEFLSCLSTRDFSCQVYRALVVELSNNTGLMDNVRQKQIFTNFILSFLSRRKGSDRDCTVPFPGSVAFIQQNFGGFSSFARIQEFSNLNNNFSALDAITVLSLEQLGELVFTPPATPVDRNNILRGVFDFLLLPSNGNKLISILGSLETQASEANFSCENYKIIFDRIDQAISSGSPNQSETILRIRDSLMLTAPNECIERAIQCRTTPVNESTLCAGVNSSPAAQFLNASGSQNVCKFSILEYACLPTLSQLSSQQAADLLACNLPSNVTKETWKLFFTKIITRLDDALLKYSNMTPSNGSLSDVLDVLGEVRIDRFSPQRLKDPIVIRSWFQGRLKPFLPSASQGFLSCLSTKNFSCENYRIIVEALGNASSQGEQDVCNPLQPTTFTQRQNMTYKEFINAFLSRNDIDDPRCLRDTANSTQWLVRNFGSFVQSAPLKDLLTLNKNFTAVEVLPLLSVRQLAEVAATPAVLADLQTVNNITRLLKVCQLAAFFDVFIPAVQGVNLTQDVKTALIQLVLDRANLSNLAIRDEDILVWIRDRLNPLFGNLTESLVAPFFNILSTRGCNLTQDVVKLLAVVRPKLPSNTQSAIYSKILLSLREPLPLRCYRNNSIFTFLNDSLLGFGPLPQLTVFLSLIPAPRKAEIINSVTPAELGTYLRQPGVVDNETEICVIFKNFGRTLEFLDTVDIPDDVKRAVLPCVWSLALTSDNQTEVDLWFDRRLKPYLKFLNRNLIGSKDTLNASCLSYSKMVKFLGSNFTFNASQLSSEDVYSTIKTYLKTESEPKCYNATDSRFNSTAWFVTHIGVFINLVSLDDLYSFGPEKTIQIFAVDEQNIKLLNERRPPKAVLNRYTELIFLQKPDLSLFLLPPIFQCDAPVSAFTKLDQNQTITILGNFKTSCSSVDPAISAALAKNIKIIDASAISNLGQESVGITVAQINNADPKVMIESLSVLSNVSGWSLGQSKAIIKLLLIGNFQLSNSENLLKLGSLIGGIPSTTLATIDPKIILVTSQNPEFRKNILLAPLIVQRTYVNQLIKVGRSPDALMANIPDEMAIQIPRTLLDIPTNANVTLLRSINQKKWKPEQAVLFFDTVADALPPDELSVEVLQGFTCSRVQTYNKTKIQSLVSACRRRQDRPKVVLSETQLTCMNNLLKKETQLEFSSYPPDMLLYYNYNNVSKAKCKSYFTEVATADFSIFSKTLRGKRDTLWSNAADCYGITGKTIKKEDLAVLGNLACVLNSDFIESSDPEILENLKNCNELSDVQIVAMEQTILKGTSKYGPTSKWNQKTLDDLGNLPLYFSQGFWKFFQEKDTSKFLKTFFKSLRAKNTPKGQMKKLFTALTITQNSRVKRDAALCTKGNITSVTISDDAFPFGYDSTQFRHCLDNLVMLDNLASLCEKVDDNNLQRVILDKLNETNPAGLLEDQVQVLKSVARSATVDEIGKWNITKVDTLAALMNADDGDWNSTQSKVIITKYLNSNNTLTATELNLVKGPNLCSLDAKTLAGISSDSLRDAEALDVSKCSSDNKKTLFSIAKGAFPISSGGLRSFQLLESYLGGADVGFIRNLSSFNVSMSMSTFIKLDESVILNLTVSEVASLLGANLEDLKTFENETIVQSWIRLQPQSELDKLNIGLTGGIAAATAAPSTVASNTTTTVTPSTVAKTTAGAPGIRGSGWSVSLTVLLVCFLTIIKTGII